MKTIDFCVEADYICGFSLVMIGQKLWPVWRKMWQFHLNMNIEGTLWRHAVTWLVTSSLWKSFWWMIYILSFHTCCQIEAILKNAKFFKLTKISGRGELFRHQSHRKLGMSSRSPVQYPTFWAFDRSSSSKIDWVITISKFDILFDLVT